MRHVLFPFQVFSWGRRNGAFFGGVGGVLTGGSGAGFFLVLGIGCEEVDVEPELGF